MFEISTYYIKVLPRNCNCVHDHGLLRFIYLFAFCTRIFFSEMHSEAIKILKGKYVVRAIEEHKMDKALIFCRTKLDCDNLEQHFINMGGGKER